MAFTEPGIAGLCFYKKIKIHIGHFRIFVVFIFPGIEDLVTVVDKGVVPDEIPELVATAYVKNNDAVRVQKTGFYPFCDFVKAVWVQDIVKAVYHT